MCYLFLSITRIQTTCHVHGTVQLIANDAHCTKLTKAQVRTLCANYLPPKLKQRYRPQQQTTDTGHTAQAAPKTICAGFLPD